MKMTKLVFLLVLAVLGINARAQWTQGFCFAPSLTLIEEVFYLSPTLAYGAATGQNEGYILKSTDGGGTWASVFMMPRSAVNDIHFPAGQSQIGYASASQLLKTTDGGVSWDSIYTPSEQMGRIFFTSTTTGYATGALNVGFFWKTTDGGFSWDLVTLSTNFRAHEMQFLGANIGYVGGGDSFGGDIGTLSKTTDAGLSWTDVAFSSAIGGAVTNGVDGMYWHDANNGYIGAGHHLLKTTDGGANWTALPTGDADSSKISGIWFTSNATGYFSTFAGEIFITNDGGATWVLNATTLGASALYFVEFANTQVGFAGSVIGMYYYTNNGGGMVGVDAAALEKAGFSVGPNPNNGQFVIRAETFKDASGEVALYDLQGKLVWQEIVSGAQLQQGHSFSVDCPAGLYALRLRSRNHGVNTKLVIE